MVEDTPTESFYGIETRILLTAIFDAIGSLGENWLRSAESASLASVYGLRCSVQQRLFWEMLGAMLIVHQLASSKVSYLDFIFSREFIGNGDVHG